jgi:hypothetical protein
MIDSSRELVGFISLRIQVTGHRRNPSLSALAVISVPNDIGYDVVGQDIAKDVLAERRKQECIRCRSKCTEGTAKDLRIGLLSLYNTRTYLDSKSANVLLTGW